MRESSCDESMQRFINRAPRHTTRFGDFVAVQRTGRRQEREVSPGLVTRKARFLQKLDRLFESHDVTVPLVRNTQNSPLNWPNGLKGAARSD